MQRYTTRAGPPKNSESLAAAGTGTRVPALVLGTRVHCTRFVVFSQGTFLVLPVGVLPGNPVPIVQTLVVLLVVLPLLECGVTGVQLVVVPGYDYEGCVLQFVTNEL